MKKRDYPRPAWADGKFALAHDLRDAGCKVSEIAATLGCGKSYVYYLLKRGSAPGPQLGFVRRDRHLGKLARPVEVILTHTQNEWLKQAAAQRAMSKSMLIRALVQQALEYEGNDENERTERKPDVATPDPSGGGEAVLGG